MREAIGSSLLFNLVIMIVIVMIAFLVGSLSYSKAFKVKNRIINIIEKHDGYDVNAVTEINSELKEMGYRVNNNTNCPNKESEGFKLISNSSSYEYCVYVAYTTSVSENVEKNPYYKVITYMYFDIPVIGGLLHFPVSGETEIIRNYYVEYEE